MYKILSHTSHSFAQALFEQFQKGKLQARDLYKSFVRTGSFEPTPRSLANAPSLFREMIARVDTNMDPLVERIQDPESLAEKFLIKTHDGFAIESVVVPMKTKKTLCVSSQIGCRMGCAFCQTGKMGLIRNLEAYEIVEQVFVARFVLGHTLQNIVFMGMGEPLDTIEEVMKAFQILSDPHGFGFGRKNITISTSGKVDTIETLAHLEGAVPNLAVSLNAVDDDLRSRLMPINRKWNLARLREAITLFVSLRKKEVLIGYVLLEGVNDSDEHACTLIDFLGDLPVKVNLIAYNSHSGSLFRSSSVQAQDHFMCRLREAGIRVLLRHSKGVSLMAACGQLGKKPSNFTI